MRTSKFEGPLLLLGLVLRLYGGAWTEEDVWNEGVRALIRSGVWFVAFAALEAPVNPMTPREADVLRLAAAGAPTVEIARQLCLTTGTVRNHISAIITKAGARNRVDVIRIADRCGWL